MPYSLVVTIDACQASLSGQDASTIFVDDEEEIEMDPVRFSLGATVRVEPCEIGPQARDFGLLFPARESHFVAGNLRFRVLHEGGEACLIPAEARGFQGG